MTRGEWEIGYFCQNCKEEIPWQDVYDDICRHCGSLDTYFRAESRARRWVVDKEEPLYRKLLGYKEIGHWEYKE